ncbi:hypothetical protein KDA00_02100 [Candidatus Saccharibacteria bacterium]|nr:hypothetical protein [Candidatus Saccharibacteria bacterium]
MDNKPEENNELDTLEDPGTVVENEQQKTGGDNAKADKPKVSFAKRIQGLVSHLNIYLLLFILILVLTGAIIFVGIQRNKKADVETTINTQPLTKETLEQLKGSEAKVGDPKQTLSIESNAIFTGKVLFRDSIDVAGTIKVGGSLSLPGLTVSGESNFDQIQANKLSVSGDVSIQGQLTVQKNLTVSGGGSFGGGISAPVVSTQSLQISGDLQFSRHLDAGGGTPGKVNGGALGSGGTSSVSGTDTAGTVQINIGGGPPAGCFVTIYFTNSFNATPHVIVTPVGGAGGGLNYYVDRSASSFSICSTNAASPGTSFSFDYMAVE